MKLFKQLQVGKPMSTETPVLNFLTYYEDSVACRKVTETMINWCSPSFGSFMPSLQDLRAMSAKENTDTRAAAGAQVNKWQKNFEQIIFDNVPVKGFAFKGVESRYSTDNKVFRITDPRGFIVEIYADNLMSLMLESNIERGEILDECIWFRKGAKNYLINVNSSVYIKAMKEVNAKKKVLANMASIRDVSVGDVVKLKHWNSINPHIYLGRHFIEVTDDGTSYTYGRCESLPPKTEQSAKKLHIFRELATDKYNEQRTLCYYAVQSVNNIVEITGNRMTPEIVTECIDDVERYNNAKIKNEHLFWFGATPRVSGRNYSYDVKVTKIVVES